MKPKTTKKKDVIILKFSVIKVQKVNCTAVYDASGNQHTTALQE